MSRKEIDALEGKIFILNKRLAALEWKRDGLIEELNRLRDKRTES